MGIDSRSYFVQVPSDLQQLLPSVGAAVAVSAAAAQVLPLATQHGEPGKQQAPLLRVQTPSGSQHSAPGMQQSVQAEQSPVAFAVTQHSSPRTQQGASGAQQLDEELEFHALTLPTTEPARTTAPMRSFVIMIVNSFVNKCVENRVPEFDTVESSVQ